MSGTQNFNGSMRRQPARPARRPHLQKKCDEEPPPWFDGSIKCTDIQSPVVAKGANSVTLTMCGLEVFRWVSPTGDPLLLDAYKDILGPWVRSRVGSKVCCSTIRNASRNGTACDPATDIDCDGGRTSRTSQTVTPGARLFLTSIFPILRSVLTSIRFLQGLTRTTWIFDRNARPQL